MAALGAASALLMAGLAWFVQLVHYPLFRSVGVAAFPRYEAEHTSRTVRIVGPLLVAEVVSAVGLVAVASPGWRLAAIGSAGCAVVAWAVTAAVAVPCHRSLTGGFSEPVLRRLLRANLVRSLAWSVRGALCLVLVTAA